MKSQFMLTCILGSAVFISPTTLGRALEVMTSQQRFSLASPMEVQEYVREIVKHINQTAEKILSIPSDLQTFENTLRPWNRLSAELISNFNHLNALAEEPSFSSTAVLEFIEDLHAFLMEVSQNSQLYGALVSCSQKITSDHASSPFQRHIASSFLKNNWSEFAHIRGSAQEKNSTETDFTVLNLKSADLPRDQGSDLAKRILSANADVVCIHEVGADDANDVYDALKEDYAHFLYVAANITATDFSGHHHHPSGMFIASKCSIEKVRFNRFQANSNNLNEGFFDFVIKNGNKSLGHIYVTNLQKDFYREVEAQKFMNIVEKMQEDILKIEEELIPFFLCGDFRALQPSEEGKILMDTYFRPEINQTEAPYALLLQSLPAFPHEILSSDYIISTTPVAMVDDYDGSLTLLKKENFYSMDDILKNICGNYWNENYTILCGHAEISGGRETDGSSKVEASVSTSTETDRGTVSFEVSGGVYQDKDGYNSGRVESTISIDW